MKRTYPVPVAGGRFGRWKIVSSEVVRRSGFRPSVRCRCDCGSELLVRTRDLFTGRSRSCGCLSSDTTAERNRTHGKCGTPEYRAWCLMLGRCSNPKAPDYKNYGGRGIRVCDEWRRSFESFLASVGPKPSRNHSLGRMNNEKGYEPENVRWETKIQQMRNTRRTHHLEIDGEKKCISEWALLKEVSPALVSGRISRLGWSPDKAVKTRPRRLNLEGLTLDGLTLPLMTWAKRKGLGRGLVRSRLARGWTVENALNTPK